MRRHSRSTLVYVLFGVLSAVFVIDFGPGSRGCGGGLSRSYAADVDGSLVTEQDYRLAYLTLSYMMLGTPNIPTQTARQARLREMVMDRLIERELLARRAEKLGFVVSDKEVEDLIAGGQIYVLGVPRRADVFFADGVFDYKRFERVLQAWFGVSPAQFIAAQKHEVLADKARQLLRAGVKVTPAEAKAAYDQREHEAELEFVRFQPRQFEGQVNVSAADIAAYQAAHADDLKKEYEQRAFLYKGLQKEAHVRRVLLSVAKDESDKARVDAAQKAAAKARKSLDGGADFTTVVRAASEDQASRGRGGDLGWRRAGYTGLSKELDDQIFAAKPGTLIGPVRDDAGFEIVRVEGFREGDITEAQAAPELAEQKLWAERTAAKAKEAADQALAKARAGQGLAAQFPKPDDSEESAAVTARPVVDDTGLFPRLGEQVPKIGITGELMKQAFTAKEGELLGPVEVSGSWVVARVKSRQAPDEKYYAEHQGEELRKMETQKWGELVGAWSKQQCTAVRDGGKLRVNDEVLAYDGEPPATKYVPCTAQPF